MSSVALAADHSVFDVEYFQKINRFKELTQIQMHEFEKFIMNETNDVSPEQLAHLKKTKEQQTEALNKHVDKLSELYRRIFIDKTASKDDRKALVYMESNLSIAVHRQLTAQKSFIEKQISTKELKTKDFAKLLLSLNSLNQELLDGKSIAVPASMGINQVFQTGNKLPWSLCKMLAGFCTRASLSHLMDSLNERHFLRDGQKYSYQNLEEPKKVLQSQSKAVFILIGNHDQPLMDIALGRKVALQLGSDQHITMTRKSVYPVPPPVSAGDVVFVVDNDPKSNPVQESLDLVSKHIQSSDKSIVSLAVYPEGMLPYTGGQMPMTVKEGAFVIARKLAVQMQAEGIPVYLVQMKTNIIEHLTAQESLRPEVKIEFIEKVPANPIDKSVPDLWIEKQRKVAENSFNSHRAKTQIDIFNLDKVPRSKIPYGIKMGSCSKVFIF